MQSLHLDALPPAEQQKAFDQIKSHWEALSLYRPKKYNGKILYFEAQEKFFRYPTLSLGSTWKELAENGLEIHLIPGNHLSMLNSPNITALAKILSRSVNLPL